MINSKGIFLKSWFLLSVSIALLWIFFVFSLPIDPDYASGELLDHFLSWKEGQDLYPTLIHEPFRVLNYTPFYFFSVRLLSTLDLPTLLAGRLTSLCFGFLGIFICYRWIKEQGLKSLESAFILTLLVTCFPVLYFLPQFHLQWTAVSLSLFSLYLLQKRSSFTCLILSSIFGILACLSKQTQIISLLIGTLWLLFQKPKQGLLYILLNIIFGTTALYALKMKFGDVAFVHLIKYTVGTFTGQQLYRQLLGNLLPWIFFFTLGILRFFKDKSARSTLLGWYFAGSSLCLLSSAREGSSHQYFLEWSLVTLIWISKPLADFINKKTNDLLGIPRLLGYFLLITQILIAITLSIFTLYRSLQENLKIRAKLPEICKIIQTYPDDWLVSEEPSLIRACGGHLAFHPFIMNNLSKKGIWDDDVFQTNIRQHKYPLLIFPFNINNDDESFRSWNQKTIHNIRENYRLNEEVGPFKFYNPLNPAR